MGPSLEIGDTVTLAFKTSAEEWKEITGTIGVDISDDTTDSLNYALYGLWEDKYKKEGEIDMLDMKNEVLKLYYEKKREEIIDKYEKKEKEYFTKNELANKFNELIEKFENDLDDLYTSVENFDNDYIVQRYDENNYKYKVNTDKLSKEFEEKYIEKRNKELTKLDNEIKEISAQLSMSDDLDYQVEVLTRYGVLDKKTKKMAD